MSQQVIVLGVHRSGTSMLAGVLHKLGVNMGETMIGPDASNPYGHWEDAQASAINRWILREAGGSWRDPPSEAAIAAVNADTQIVPFVAKRESQHKLWGTKDPRLVLTIPKWALFFNNPKYVWADRPGYNVVASTVKRNRMSREDARDLWNEYRQRLLSWIGPRLERGSRHDVYYWNYDQARKDPAVCVEYLALWLGVEPTQAAVEHIHV